MEHLARAVGYIVGCVVCSMVLHYCTALVKLEDAQGHERAMKELELKAAGPK